MIRSLRKLPLALSLIMGLSAVSLSRDAGASIDVDGVELEVVDMHLHPGAWTQMHPEGKRFVAESIPPSLRGYAPAIFDQALSPFAAELGIRSETEAAGIDHAVLFAVYTHHTTGYFTNEQLLAALTDERNAGWAWGLASVNLDELDAESLQPRVDAMASYLTERPDLFIGVKLAHAHQSVRFDDEASFAIFDAAGQAGAPVLLHTGFSPFPGSEETPEYYDPAYLTDVVTMYDGSGSAPRVDFVLSHVGQGDARAVEAALQLAEDHDNVWLEISALGRPLLFDADGVEVEDGDAQYPWVLAEIKARGLVDRTIYASDGPQLSGTVNSYLQKMVDGMLEAAFTTDEIASVLAGNFHTLYGV
jgi:hypothetical protein